MANIKNAFEIGGDGLVFEKGVTFLSGDAHPSTLNLDPTVPIFYFRTNQEIHFSSGSQPSGGSASSWNAVPSNNQMVQAAVDGIIALLYGPVITLDSGSPGSTAQYVVVDAGTPTSTSAVQLDGGQL